jgi:predicted RNA-binding protein
MCESNVYLKDEDSEKLVMEDVALLKQQENKIWLVDLLGEEKELEGKVHEIDFLDHKVVIGREKE